MFKLLLLSTILLLVPYITYTMDPAPKNSTEPAPRKTSREPRRRLLGSLHKTSSSAKLPQYNLQDTSHPIIPNPAICITPEQSSTDPIKLQRTFSSLLRSSSGHEETQSLSPESYFEPEKNLQQPLLQKNVANKKSVPNLRLKNTEKSSSWSESPSTSPRKKSSPSQHSHKKLTTSSPYGSPRETKSSHSSPRELVTYDDVIKAFTQKSKITKAVKAFLQNADNNPNEQDKDTGLTILHRAVLKHDEKTTEIILSYPGTDSSIEDYNSRKALDFIKDEIIKYEKLFNALKARETVDLIINALMITNKLLQDPHCPQEFMRQIVNAFLEKTLPKTLPKYTNCDFFITAIRYRQAGQLSLLKDFHKQFKKNTNYQDKLGNTMLHYAAIVLDNLLITRLICNPYLDSSIRNKEHCIAAQLIPSSSNIKTEHLTDTIIKKIQYLKHLRTLLFTRDSLEYLCAKEAPMIKKLICPDISAFTLHKQIDNKTDDKKTELNPDKKTDDKKTKLNPDKKTDDKKTKLNPDKKTDDKKTELNPDKKTDDKKTELNPDKKTDDKKAELNPDFIQAKKVMEEGFEIIARGQGDSDLPEGTEFPPYATDEFLYEKLKIKLEAKDPIVESTQAVIEKLLEELKKESDLIQSGQIKLKHIVIEKKLEPKKDPDTTSQPINDQDPLVSKSSED